MLLTRHLFALSPARLSSPGTGRELYLFLKRGIASNNNNKKNVSSKSQKKKSGNRKGKNGKSGGGIPKELTMLRHSLFTAPFGSGKAAELAAFRGSEEYMKISEEYAKHRAAKTAEREARLQQQQIRMREACLNLQQEHPALFANAMQRPPTSQLLFPPQRRVPTDTPGNIPWPI